MNTTLDTSPLAPGAAELPSAIDHACARIAPTWPLDRFIAVNPYCGAISSGRLPPLQPNWPRCRAAPC